MEAVTDEIYEILTETNASVNGSIQRYGLTADECLQNATADFTSAILLEQDNAEYRYKRGMAFLRRGINFDEAIDDIRGAVEMEEENAIYNFECAKILIDYGDDSLDTNREAKEYLERSIDELDDKS
jgi:tetratricopeptide (TPR) repeat protein